MQDNPTVLRAVDTDGSTATVYPCTLPTWGWQYCNNIRHEFEYGWTNSEAAAIAEAKRLLKPGADGAYPAFVVVPIATD